LDDEGNLRSELFAEEQTSDSMMKILGYTWDFTSGNNSGISLM
jgi:hypothetical protein